MAKKSNAGRKTSFKKEYIEQAVKLCKKGFIDIELADFFNVSKATINNWKKEYPEFLDSLKKGKNFSDAKVEQALYDRALGFEYKELKKEESTSPHGSATKTTKTTKKVVGDTTAQIFWLKNRQPERWKDKRDAEHKTDGIPITLNFTKAEKPNAN